MNKILIIDDDRSLRELLTDYLGRLGHDIVGAPDGQTGLDLLGAGPRLQECRRSEELSLLARIGC